MDENQIEKETDRVIQSFLVNINIRYFHFADANFSLSSLYEFYVIIWRFSHHIFLCDVK